MAKMQIMGFEFDTRETWWDVIQKRKEFTEKYGTKAGEYLLFALAYLVMAEIEAIEKEENENDSMGRTD